MARYTIHDPECARMKPWPTVRFGGSTNPPACTCKSRVKKLKRLYIREASNCPGRAGGTWYTKGAGKTG